MLRVNNLTGFGGGAAPDIIVTDDGDSAPSSGTGTDTHTYSAKTSTGPDTILVMTWDHGGVARQPDSITWDGNAMSELVDTGLNAPGGVAIYYISGAQSGDIVITMSGLCDDSHITILSLDNLSSGTAVDTDTDVVASGDPTLAALASPGRGGVRIAGAYNGGQATAFTWSWTGHTEAADLDAGAHRHGVAYEVAAESDSISVDGDDTAVARAAGVSLR